LGDVAIHKAGGRFIGLLLTPFARKMIVSRSTLLTIFLAVVVSVLCYSRAEHNLYARNFTEGLELIQARALEPVPRQQLFESAMRGMVSELDEYSAFIAEADAQKYREDLEQHFGGIGIEVYFDGETKTLAVGSPIIGSPRPAFEAGMRGGDRIVSIEGKPTDDLSMSEAVDIMRGEVGTPIRIAVVHAGQTDPQQLSIMREEINVDSVLGDRRDAAGNWIYTLEGEPRVGYLRLKTFGERTSQEMREALQQLNDDKRLQALIVDVRDNSGGYLQAADEVCDLFIRQGRIVSTRGRGGRLLSVYDASSAGTFDGFPMAVLINQGSASASEIFAACLKDHDRAAIIGERSWGKGSVQQMLPMENGKSILKLTTASYWRPSGRNIHRLKDEPESGDWGVRPSPGHEITLSDEEEKEMRTKRRLRDGYVPDALPGAEPPENYLDPQLRAAAEMLRERRSAESPQGGGDYKKEPRQVTSSSGP